MSKEAIKFIETDNWKYLNQIFETREFRKVKVIDIIDKNDVLVEYQDKTHKTYRLRMANVLLGLVPMNLEDSPVKFDTPRDFYMNSVWHTKEGYIIRVLSYINEINVEVEFVHDGTRILTTSGAIRKGSVAYPYRPNRFGGVVGVGRYKNSANNEKYYDTWYSMLERGTEIGKETSKKYNTNLSAYKNVSISDEWMNYQNFAQWYDEYIHSLNPKYYDDYQLDKDILQWDREYKVYSKDTCCLVPKIINIMLNSTSTKKNNLDLPVGVKKTNVNSYTILILEGYGKEMKKRSKTFHSPDEAFKEYKRNKESRIQYLAEKYYAENAIKKEIYDILMNMDIKPCYN